MSPSQLERRKRLFELAATQGGYFTAAQAREIGYDSRTLWHHTKSGALERISRGFYRLAEFPTQSHEDVIAAWVKAGPGRAVVSHETALALYNLASIRQRNIHITVPRKYRPHKGQVNLPAVKIHTTTRGYRLGEVIQRFGVRVTSPARTIADAAQAGTDPSSIIEAVTAALEQGLLSTDELWRAAEDRPRRVRDLLERAIEQSDRRARVR